MVNTVENIIATSLKTHKDWWDEDEMFDLAADIVDELYPDNIGMTLHLDLVCKTSDYLEDIEPQVPPEEVREAAEKIVEGLKREMEKHQARHLAVSFMKSKRG